MNISDPTVKCMHSQTLRQKVFYGGDVSNYDDRHSKPNLKTQIKNSKVKNSHVVQVFFTT